MTEKKRGKQKKKNDIVLLVAVSGRALTAWLVTAVFRNLFTWHNNATSCTTRRAQATRCHWYTNPLETPREGDKNVGKVWSYQLLILSTTSAGAPAAHG